MEIKMTAIAGTMESSDVMITLEKNTKTENIIMLQSSVEKQFGDQIRKVIACTLDGMGIHGVKVSAVDKGALDCTIRARVMTAVHRACGDENYKWEDPK